MLLRFLFRLPGGGSRFCNRLYWFYPGHDIPLVLGLHRLHKTRPLIVNKTILVLISILHVTISILDVNRCGGHFGG